MVLTRSEIKNLTRKELMEKLLNLSDIGNLLKVFNHRFNTLTAKCEELKSEFSQQKLCLKCSIFHKCHKISISNLELFNIS